MLCTSWAGSYLCCWFDVTYPKTKKLPVHLDRVVIVGSSGDVRSSPISPRSEAGEPPLGSLQEALGMQLCGKCAKGNTVWIDMSVHVRAWLCNISVSHVRTVLIIIKREVIMRALQTRESPTWCKVNVLDSHVSSLHQLASFFFFFVFSSLVSFFLTHLRLDV